MSLTLGALAATRRLGLSIVTGQDKVARVVRSAHVAETDDPTAFLEGGELLLTTGAFEADLDDWQRYADRLVKVDVAAVGFAVGHGYDQVPEGLIEAATGAGLPLLAVPRSTPFVAISKAVAAAVTGADQRALGGAVTVQRDLARAALSSTGPREVAQRLARALGAWALLIDQAGEARFCTPETSRRHLARVRMDLARLRDKGAQTSAVINISGDSASIFPLGVHGRVRGFLVVGRPTPLTVTERSVLTTAVALLSLDLHTTWRLRTAERRERSAVARLVVEGHPELAASLAEHLGIPYPEGRLRVALLGVPRSYEAELLDRAEDDYGLKIVSAVVAEWEPGRVVVLLPHAEGDLRTLQGVLRQVPHAQGTVSDPVAAVDVADAWRRVRSAFEAAQIADGQLVLARDVAQAGLLGHLATPQAQGWSAALLAPLEEYSQSSKVDLLETLQVFLSNNGQTDTSATALGIHRHTLRYRVSKAAELLGRDLDDPTVRFELWVALRLRSLL